MGHTISFNQNKCISLEFYKLFDLDIMLLPQRRVSHYPISNAINQLIKASLVPRKLAFTINQGRSSACRSGTYTHYLVTSEQRTPNYIYKVDDRLPRKKWPSSWTRNWCLRMTNAAGGRSLTCCLTVTFCWRQFLVVDAGDHFSVVCHCPNLSYKASASASITCRMRIFAF